MAFLKSSTRNKILLNDLMIAQDFFARAKGLLGREKLEPQQGLWIHSCQSIHTFFMNFSIDCIFLDRKLVIKKIYSDVKPWRVTWPVWSANTVIELPAGRAKELDLKIGEVLDVGT